MEHSHPNDGLVFACIAGCPGGPPGCAAGGSAVAVRMRYVGGKARIAKWVAAEIALIKGDRSIYIEPFVGSGASLVANGGMFDEVFVGDGHLDVVLMWRAIAEGWDPPRYVSKDEYKQLSNSVPSALRGLVGFGSSWGGKWFGGYTHTIFDKHHGRDTKPYLSTAVDSVLRSRAAFERALVIEHCDYSEWVLDDPVNTVIYCDPPYEGTQGYAGTGAFDSAAFWEMAVEWADNGALVIVSEQNAPLGWTVLAERTRKSMMRVASNQSNTLRREALFVRDETCSLRSTVAV